MVDFLEERLRELLLVVIDIAKRGSDGRDATGDLGNARESAFRRKTQHLGLPTEYCLMWIDHRRCLEGRVHGVSGGL